MLKSRNQRQFNRFIELSTSQNKLAESVTYLKNNYGQSRMLWMHEMIGVPTKLSSNVQDLTNQSTLAVPSVREQPSGSGQPQLSLIDLTPIRTPSKEVFEDARSELGASQTRRDPEVVANQTWWWQHWMDRIKQKLRMNPDLRKDGSSSYMTYLQPRSWALDLSF